MGMNFEKNKDKRNLVIVDQPEGEEWHIIYTNVWYETFIQIQLCGATEILFLLHILWHGSMGPFFNLRLGIVARIFFSKWHIPIT